VASKDAVGVGSVLGSLSLRGINESTWAEAGSVLSPGLGSGIFQG
jgi:hypothetical protein